MIKLRSTGWQATMIDLSLILFLLTAAALTKAGPGTGGGKDTSTADLPSLSQMDNASAVYSADASAPPFADWLAEQTPDPRQRLTIFASYAEGGEAKASADALRLLSQAGGAGINARVVLEAGDEPRLVAVLGYDLDARQLARSLPEDVRSPRPERANGDTP